MISLPTRSRRGFLLFEVILALAVFGIAAVGFIVAMHRTADAAQLAQSRLRITRVLDSALSEAVSLPTMEEGVTTTDVQEHDMTVVTKIEAMQDQLQNEDGVALQEMYLITVTIRWRENNLDQEQSARTWRYGRMYQP